MEKSHPDKKGSFRFLRAGSRKHADKSLPAEEVAVDPLPDTSLADVLREVDTFVTVLSSTEDKSIPPEVPITAEALPAKVDVMIARPDGGGDSDDDDLLLVEAVQRLVTLNNLLSDFTSVKFGNRVFAALQRTTPFLEKRMRTLLEDCTGCKPRKTKSFGKNSDPNRWDTPGSTGGSDEFPGYSESAVSKMSRLAAVMISAGNESECCQIYHVTRRKALKSALNRYGFEKIGVEDVQKMSWEVLEGQISTCIHILKACTIDFFPPERKLCELIFSDYPDIYYREYTHLCWAMLSRLLNFADTVTAAKRSTEKLFKLLDLYECFRDVTIEIEDSFLQCGVTDLTVEISNIKERIAESAIMIFCELESSIINDDERTTVPNGAVHPSTRYIMNYLKYACEYRSTLEQVFLLNQTLKPVPKEDTTEPATPNNDGAPKKSPFAAHVMNIVNLLDESLEAKSLLYKDISLGLVFLMNNGRYVLQKIKGSNDIHEMVGDNCYRRRSSAVRKHHKSYTRETWGRLLQNLTYQGLQVTSGKLNNKPLLKERLKNFCTMFEEIHKTQSMWVVSDEQLKSEMRASVAAVVIPAYRSFLGRFQQFFVPGKQTEKYFKYQPEDIENLIDRLFDGNPSLIGKKTKHH